MKGGWVYIMTNKPGGVLYIGVAARSPSTAPAKGPFLPRYNLKRPPRRTLSHHHEAIAREKAMKEWQRAWKVRRIEEANPHWDDLWKTILG